MEQIVGDNGGHFPDHASARAYLEGAKGSNTSADYHSDRLRALKLLIDAANLGSTFRAVDFGCGDGMYFKEFFQPSQISKIVGVDVSGPMVEIASETLKGFKFTGKVGGADALKDLPSGHFDIAFAIDVLGYLDEQELDVFYTEAARILRPGGKLIVMYGNELFDMFALNSGTAAFYEKHFGLSVAEFLVEGNSPQYKPANRKNPLSFGAEISLYGFKESRQSFSQWHKVPPALGNRNKSDLSAARMDMRDHAFDPNQLPADKKWTANFRCSIFASLSERV